MDIDDYNVQQNEDDDNYSDDDNAVVEEPLENELDRMKRWLTESDYPYVSSDEDMRQLKATNQALDQELMERNGKIEELEKRAQELEEKEHEAYVFNKWMDGDS